MYGATEDNPMETQRSTRGFTFCARAFQHLLCGTLGSKIFRTLVITLAIFLFFDWQLLSSHAYYKKYKALKL